ncbi:MAG: glycosyltransferase [Chitinophagaceae bacterium]
MCKILWLASWYPNKISPRNGDFIQRHAEAAAMYEPVHVIYVVKDEYKRVTSNVTIEHFTRGKLSESIAYYKPLECGIKIFDRLLSILTCLKIYRKLIISFIRLHGRPALVHVHVAMWAGIPALWLKIKYRISYVVTEHWTGYYKNAEDAIYKKGWLFNILTRKILKRSDLILPDCHQLGKCINDHICRVSFQVIPNVVDTRIFNSSNYQGLPFRFVHVSTMNPNKNAVGILNSFSKLLVIYSDWRLVMVGTASDDLKNTANQLGLKNFINWKGAIPYVQVAEAMSASSALIMFSRFENMPCVILEALCCGLPVIATTVGGIPEIVNKKNGILVHSEDEMQLLDALIELMENYHSYSRSAISAEATEKYNYHTIGKIFFDLYSTYSRSR